VSYHTLTGQELVIFKYLQENKQVTRKEVEQLLDVKASRANLILKKMVDNNILIKEGLSKNIVYKVK
jgi:predicted HTH transcriptional regulator